eukprot:CAMPEP_0119380704 /NCGR_PEP_ID=MMETSP1334-20130426/57877_1 /TAXON_ID=127549 /ORGANISM="Calcidiscus leptoporus, Strain RCC1130" /LENGTH=214 /DNA_ID=CAMNT_0007400633 /DNA_START=468 /DNA_END=1112 /DNA_ORIENTATION=+
MSCKLVTSPKLFALDNSPGLPPVPVPVPVPVTVDVVAVAVVVVSWKLFALVGSFASIGVAVVAVVAIVAFWKFWKLWKLFDLVISPPPAAHGEVCCRASFGRQGPSEPAGATPSFAPSETGGGGGGGADPAASARLASECPVSEAERSGQASASQLGVLCALVIMLPPLGLPQDSAPARWIEKGARNASHDAERRMGCGDDASVPPAEVELAVD